MSALLQATHLSLEREISLSHAHDPDDRKEDSMTFVRFISGNPLVVHRASQQCIALCVRRSTLCRWSTEIDILMSACSVQCSCFFQSNILSSGTSMS